MIATTPTAARTSRPIALLVGLTLMLAGRAMTLAFLGRVGGGGPADPPAVWLLPLLGDAIIGLTALPIAYRIMRTKTLTSWVLVIVWNAVAIWDALGAFLVSRAAPWPSFFMVQIFGSSMFFAASAMHAACIYLVCRTDVRGSFFEMR